MDRIIADLACPCNLTANVCSALTFSTQTRFRRGQEPLREPSCRITTKPESSSP